MVIGNAFMNRKYLQIFEGILEVLAHVQVYMLLLLIFQKQIYLSQYFLKTIHSSNNWAFADEADFNHTATLLLIEFIRQRFQRFLLIHSRAAVYREVQEELCFRGFSFTIEKIRRKWNNLITTYRRIKEKNSEDPKVKIMWDYFQVWSHRGSHGKRKEM